MAFDVQTLNEAARCAECLSPNQKQNVLLYLLNGILEGGSGGTVLHNLLSLTHPDTVPGPPTRGALVVGNATPDWESLPIGAANRVLRSDGVDATWSQLVLTTDVTGILPIANGGTNSSAALNNNRIMVSSGGAIVEAAALTNGQLLIGSTGAAPVAASLTAGANITITPGAGSITIASTIGTHTILDAVVHTDSVTQAVTRGSLIYGNSTPKWDELAIGAAGRFLGSDGTDVSWTVLPGSFTGFANPTAFVGLVVVNGVATTAMRSDAAPPLDQAIAPTWTGPHIFSPTTALAIQLNPFGAAAGNTSELRFLELVANGTNYTGFKAADAMAASEIYVLPNAAPSANRFLRAGAVAAGVSTLSWTQISLTADVTGILPVANGGTGTGTAFTQGSVIFAGAAGVFSEDNASFFWDDTNNRLGIGTIVPAGYLELSSNLFPSNNALIITLSNDTGTNFPNIFYRRSRGTVALPTAVLADDRLGGFGFRGYGATGYFTADNAVFRAFAAENFTNTAMGTYVTLETTPLGSTTRLERVRIDPSSLSMSPTGTAAGSTNQLRFLELAANGTNYTGFRASDAMAASEIYVLPNAAPAGNRFLQAAAVAGGVSALSWAQVSLTADVTGILPVANGGSGTSTAFTEGSVIFAGAAGVYSQDNANLFYDDTANRLTVNQIGIPVALSATVGGIYFGAVRGIHDFGTDNFFAGSGSGNFTLSGTLNTGVGVGVLQTLTSGLANVAVGYRALFASTTGARHTAVGYLALGANTTGQNNTAVGFQALAATTTGNSNVAVGYQCLMANTTGSESTALGMQSLLNNTSGTANTAIGILSLSLNTIGSLNTAIGYQSMMNNIDGGNNVAIGYRALLLNSSGGNNMAIGLQALQGNTTGSRNVGVGYQTLFLCSTGNDNLAFGFVAGDNITTGSNNIVIGANLDSPTATNSNTLTIGNLIFGTAIDGTGVVLSSGNIGIGVITPLAKFHVTNSAAATVATIIKAAAAQSANLTEWQSSAAVANTVINAAGNISIPTTTSAVGIIFQGSTRLIHTFGTNNYFAGAGAGNFTLTGSFNVGIGVDTLSALTSGVRNVAIGYQVLVSNTTGIDNMGLGYGTLILNTTGSNNSAIGASALFNNTIGVRNTAIGFQSMIGNIDGNSNSAIGYVSLMANTSGNQNVAIGYGSLSANTTGSNNIALGFTAGNNITTGSNNIVIGYDMDSPTATNSNTLVIGNLIFGASVDGSGTVLSSGGIGIGVITPTAKLHLRAGTTAASTAPLKFNTGTSMTAAEAGAMEFTTDDLFFTITTGSARKRLLMADATAGLTSGKIPIATTNGRLIDLTASAAYTPTNVTTDRAFDANATSVDELGDVLGTLIADLQAVGVLG